MSLPIPQMKWGAHYHVGVAEVDDQHEQIVAVINAMCENLRSGAPEERQAPLIEELIRRAVEHFEYEEGLMKKSLCPDYELHKAEHEFFAAQALNFQEQFHGGLVKVDEAFLVYLKDWLRNHMLVADRRMSRHLRASGFAAFAG